MDHFQWLQVVAAYLIRDVAVTAGDTFVNNIHNPVSIRAPAIQQRSGDRKAATEFSFLVGIPTMYAASGYALLKELRHGTGDEDWNALGIAFAVSTITAFVVVKWLIRYIQTHTFNVFALYRIALGIALLLWLPSGS